MVQKLSTSMGCFKLRASFFYFVIFFFMSFFLLNLSYVLVLFYIFHLFLFLFSYFFCMYFFIYLFKHIYLFPRIHGVLLRSHHREVERARAMVQKLSKVRWNNNYVETTNTHNTQHITMTKQHEQITIQLLINKIKRRGRRRPRHGPEAFESSCW